MRSFAHRSTEAEWMDGETPYEVFAACLKDLAKANTATLARPPTIAWLARLAAGLAPGASLSVLDVGFGQGDMLRAIHRWAVRTGLRPRLTGIDLSAWSAPAARAATPRGMSISYRTGDVFALKPAVPFDAVVSSLVAHHMSDEQLVRFIAWMEANTTRGWFINDLHRHPIAFYGFRALSWAARWHPFVRHDGPISVARAFCRSDWEALLARAGVAPGTAEIVWRFPFRLCVGRIK